MVLMIKNWPQERDGLTEMEKRDNKIKLERVGRRLIEALKDAVEIFERAAPEWIDD